MVKPAWKRWSLEVLLSFFSWVFWTCLPRSHRKISLMEKLFPCSLEVRNDFSLPIWLCPYASHFFLWYFQEELHLRLFSLPTLIYLLLSVLSSFPFPFIPALLIMLFLTPWFLCGYIFSCPDLVISSVQWLLRSQTLLVWSFWNELRLIKYIFSKYRLTLYSKV